MRWLFLSNVSRLNWNLECGSGKPEDPEKTLGTRTGINNKLNPHLTLGMKINLGPQQC